MPEDKLNSDFEDEEITEVPAESPENAEKPVIKRLTYDEFKTWKQERVQNTYISIPVWLDFYMDFYEMWRNKDHKSKTWMKKLQETAPVIVGDIIKKIDDYYKSCEEFETACKEGRIATNTKGVSKIVLLIKIESVMYEAYKVARCFVDDDEILFSEKKEKETKPPLSYEEFCMWDDQMYEGKPVGKYPRYNNFIHKFLSWDIHQKNPAIRGMQKEIPELYEKLSKIIRDFFIRQDTYKTTPPQERIILNIKEPDIQETLIPLQAGLYRAYLVARKYASDEELFS